MVVADGSVRKFNDFAACWSAWTCYAFNELIFFPQYDAFHCCLPAVLCTKDIDVSIELMELHGNDNM